jgi:hypothetical protein
MTMTMKRNEEEHIASLAIKKAGSVTALSAF